MIIPTNLTDLDELLGGGLRPSSLVTVGGRPGMGKTAFLISLATHLIQKKIKFLFISLEYKEEYITKLLLRNIADVDLNIKDKDISGIQYQQMVYAANMMQETDAFLCSERYFQKVKEEILKLPDDVKVVFIDYLQLFLMPPGYEETSKAIIELKNLCHEKDICIIVASQLSRNIENRQGHRPMLIDYRDSGAIEETADQCLFILRREYYDPMDKPGMAEIILAKNRFGYLGNCIVSFYKECMKFYNFTPIKYDQAALDRETASVFGDFKP